MATAVRFHRQLAIESFPLREKGGPKGRMREAFGLTRRFAAHPLPEARRKGTRKKQVRF
jgi:hypothetical protein